MIKISKEEMEYLVASGCKWGSDIHRTFSRYKHYYVTETPKVKAKLAEYNKRVRG